jgi:hypothetical protein
MNKILIMLVAAAIVALSLMYIVPGSAQLILQQRDKPAYAQGEANVDSSPVAAVITINEDVHGNIIYEPNNMTVGVGKEIFVLNNSTDNQSVTNGMGPDDPLAGRFFDTGPIQPRGFAEFVTANLSPGNYSFYSTNSTSTTGVLIIEPNPT